MVSTRLLNQDNILASLKPNEKFSFENDSDEYYFIHVASFNYVLWNDTQKRARKIDNSTYKNAELKIHRL